MPLLEKLTLRDGGLGDDLDLLLESKVTKLRCHKTILMDEYLKRVETLVSIKITDIITSNSLCQYLDNKPLLKSLSFQPTHLFTVPPTLHKLEIYTELVDTLDTDMYNFILSIITNNQTLDSLHLHIPTANDFDIPLLTSSSNMLPKDTIFRLILKHPFECLAQFVRIVQDLGPSNPIKVESLTLALLATKIKHITISLCDESSTQFANRLEAWVNSRPKHNLFAQRIQDTSTPDLTFKESTSGAYIPTNIKNHFNLQPYPHHEDMDD
eukprot:gene15458-18341_t